VRAVLGRTLAPADDTRGCAGSAVLSYGFWQSEYGGRTDILGKTISIDRHPIEIVGVSTGSVFISSCLRLRRGMVLMRPFIVSVLTLTLSLLNAAHKPPIISS
jgi:hypothetical protein